VLNATASANSLRLSIIIFLSFSKYIQKGGKSPYPT